MLVRRLRRRAVLCYPARSFRPGTTPRVSARRWAGGCAPGSAPRPVRGERPARRPPSLAERRVTRRWAIGPWARIAGLRQAAGCGSSVPPASVRPAVCADEASCTTRPRRPVLLASYGGHGRQHALEPFRRWARQGLKQSGRSADWLLTRGYSSPSTISRRISRNRSRSRRRLAPI